MLTTSNAEFLKFLYTISFIIIKTELCVWVIRALVYGSVCNIDWYLRLQCLFIYVVFIVQKCVLLNILSIILFPESQSCTICIWW